MRVLQVAAFPFPSSQGSQVYVSGMARALARRGHEVTLACYAHGVGEPDPALRMLRAPPWPGYNNLRAGPDRVKPLLDLALGARLWRRRGEGAWDIVHAHNVEAPILAWPAAYALGAPLVYSAHTLLGAELPNYLHGAAARRAGAVLGGVVDRALPRVVQAAVVLSEEAEAAMRAGGCPEVALIPPGVDAEDLDGADPDRARARWGLGEGPWVAYAGNPDVYQDLPVLVRAVAELHARRIPDAPGLLMISASPMPELEALAAPIPAARRRFIQANTWTEVRDLLACAQLAASPRGSCPGFPIKLLNTLGLGLPTVCAPGSARDIAGVVRAPHAEFGEVILGLCRDRAQREALGRAAAADVRERFTWEASALRLEALYERLRSTNRARLG